jgi:hypothetical protein
MDSQQDPRCKLVSYLRSVDRANLTLTVNDDLPILPHIIQRLHKVLSDGANSYLDGLFCHIIMRDTINFDDCAFDMFKLDLNEHLSGTRAHSKMNTVNKSLRKMMDRSSQLIDLKSSIKELVWKTREGLKHEFPTLCDYCDCLAVISERMRLPYRSVYQCFGGGSGHYNALQGKFPITGRPRTSEVSYRYNFVKAGLKWTDFKGEAQPKNSHVLSQVKQTEAFLAAEQLVTFEASSDESVFSTSSSDSSEVQKDDSSPHPDDCNCQIPSSDDCLSPVSVYEDLKTQDSPKPAAKKRKPTRSAFYVAPALTIKRQLFDYRSKDEISVDPFLFDHFDEPVSSQSCATDLMSLACCPRVYDEVPDV